MKLFGKFIRGKLFEYIFVLFSFLSIFYVSDRMGKMLNCFFHIDLSLVILALLGILFGYMFLYMKCGKEKKSTRNLYEICSVVVCFLLYLVMAFWIYDIADSLFHINQDKWYFVPVIGSAFLVFYGFVHAKKIYLKEYDVPIKQYKKKENIVLLSDIHVGTFVDFQQLKKIVSDVNKILADKVIIAGDMFDVEAFKYCDKAKTAKILRELKPEGEVYAVLGNHDPGSASEEIRQFYKDANIKLMIDEVIETEQCILVGRDDVTVNSNRKKLPEIISTVTEKKPKIVIDHNPLGIREAVENDIDLILCGHTHKGQFFPADVFTRLAYGKQGFYGCFKEKNTQSIVSSGAGFFQMPMRIGSNSEIVLLHIK